MTRIATIGLLVLDRIFRLARLPHEAGKHFSRQYREVIGGVAVNGALAVKHLGGEVQVIGRIGDDRNGAALQDILRDGGIDTSGIETVAGATTATAAVFIDDAGERMIVSHKLPGLFDAPPRRPLLPPVSLGAILCDLRWLAGTAQALSEARARGIAAVLDYDQGVSEEGYDVIANASHVIFGAQGLAELAGEDDPPATLSGLACRMPHVRFAVTCGEHGVYYVDGGGKIAHLPAHDVKVMDTLGAGDVFHGAAALALAQGHGFADALVFANGVAAVRVGRPSGPGCFPDRAEVRAFLRRHEQV